jgi:hypothetical protein
MHRRVHVARDRRIDVRRLWHEAALLIELAQRVHARKHRLRIRLLQRDDGVDDGSE